MGLPGPPPTLAVDHVVALVHQRHHLAEQRRRILQIGIDRQHPITAGEMQPGRQRLLMPEIPRQIDRDDMRINRRQRPHHR